jgi:chromosome segregation ATPase
MEATSLPIPGAEGWSDQFAAALSKKQENVREFLASQQERLRRAEAELAEQLQIIAREVASERSETDQAKSDLDVKTAHLAEQTERLEKLKSEFGEQQSQWETLHKRYLDEQRELAAELERREAEIARRRDELHQQQNSTEESLLALQHEKRALEAARAELESNRAESSATGERLNALKAELDQRREALDAWALETENARRRIAREFKSQHAAHLKELERRRSLLEEFRTGDQSVLQRRCEELQKNETEREAEANSLRKRASELSAEIKSYMDRESDLVAEIKKLRVRESELSTELESLRQQQNDHSDAQESAQGHRSDLMRRVEAGLNQQEESSAEIHSVRARCRELEEQLAQASLETANAARKCDEFQAERRGLQSQLSGLQSELAEAKEQLSLAERSASKEPAEISEDSNRLYEMAMDDVKELKAKNEELQQQLAKANSGGGGGGGSSASKRSGDVLDWEAEKKRILAALESDYDDEKSKSERMEIETIIRKTDAIIAEKNREIDELKMLLENQSNNLGSVAVGAAALGQMLDEDAIVCEERENLKHIQEEWREKLRLAEVEISIERAKLARDKSQLEERLRQMEHLGVSPNATPQETKTPAKPSRGKWLEKLGLKDGDKEK